MSTSISATRRLIRSFFARFFNVRMQPTQMLTSNLNWVQTLNFQSEIKQRSKWKKHWKNLEIDIPLENKNFTVFSYRNAVFAAPNNSLNSANKQKNGLYGYRCRTLNYNNEKKLTASEDFFLHYNINELAFTVKWVESFISLLTLSSKGQTYENSSYRKHAVLDRFPVLICRVWILFFLYWPDHRSTRYGVCLCFKKKRCMLWHWDSKILKTRLLTQTTCGKAATLFHPNFIMIHNLGRSRLTWLTAVILQSIYLGEHDLLFTISLFISTSFFLPRSSHYSIDDNLPCSSSLALSKFKPFPHFYFLTILQNKNFSVNVRILGKFISILHRLALANTRVQNRSSTTIRTRREWPT